jgi:hypothetical protein
VTDNEDTKPIQFIREPARDIPVLAQADVLVTGGGPTGVMAAVAAARQGSSVLLVEQAGYVGGQAAIWLPLLSFLDVNGNQVIRGIPQEMIDRLQELNGSDQHRRCKLHVGYTIYDSELFKRVAVQMLKEAGVRLLLHSWFARTLCSDGTIDAVLIENKSGRQALQAQTYMDCTGDADVAAASGVPIDMGDARGGMQPATLMFRVRDVDVDMFRRSLIQQPDRYQLRIMTADQLEVHSKFIAVGLSEIIREARAEGEFPLPNDRVIVISTPFEDEMAVNMVRVPGTDSTKADVLTQAEITAQEQVPVILAFLRGRVPGFERARISWVAPRIGIRESRRIIGEYVLTEQDILTSRRFEDVVAVAGYPIDLHHPHDYDCTMSYPPSSYDIPFRCLVPLNVDNLLVAGRCISTTHAAMSATRVMATCMALGQAAGCAAALCAERRISPRQLKHSLLQQQLRASGAYLGPT